MERRLLYINRSEESPLNFPDTELIKKAQNSDKDTLLLVIQALLDNNAALRKYIDLIEKENNIK